MSEISQDESTKKRCLEKKRTSIAKAVIGRIYYTQSRMDKEGCLRGGGLARGQRGSNSFGSATILGPNGE